MLESKKRMSQYYSDLKSALEKGKGDPQTIFQDFEKASRDFFGETGKVPREVGDDFLKQVAQVGAKIKSGDLVGAVEKYGRLKRQEKILS